MDLEFNAFTIVIIICLGLITGSIAKSKGDSFLFWCVFGMALFIIAFPMVLFLKSNKKELEKKHIIENDLKKCPMCAELVKREALICRFCNHKFELIENKEHAFPCIYCGGYNVEGETRCQHCKSYFA